MEGNQRKENVRVFVCMFVCVLLVRSFPWLLNWFVENVVECLFFSRDKSNEGRETISSVNPSTVSSRY